MTGNTTPLLRIAIGGDHAGFLLKEQLRLALTAGTVVPHVHEPSATRSPGLVEIGAVIDCGTTDETSCDYPDFAVAVSRELLEGRADRGVLVCGSGVGVSVAANKIPGIRAAVCHDTYTAHQGVEHDDMNVLCIGARVIGPELAMEIVRSFLGAKYQPEERHARRLEKVLQIERAGVAAK